MVRTIEFGFVQFVLNMPDGGIGVVSPMLTLVGFRLRTLVVKGQQGCSCTFLSCAR